MAGRAEQRRASGEERPGVDPSSGSGAPRRASRARAPAPRRSPPPPPRVPSVSMQLLLVGPGEVEVPARRSGERTSEKPFAWSPLDGEADDRVAGPRRGAVDQLVALDDADAAARRGRTSPGSIRPGCSAVSPPTRAQPASRQPAATPADELGDLLRVEPPDRDVVEEEQRLGAAADDVVGAHRDEVEADRVVAAERRGDRGLRADAVGRRDEDRLAIARRDRDRRRRTRRARRAPPAGGCSRRRPASARPPGRRRRRRRPTPRRRPRRASATGRDQRLSSRMNLREADVVRDRLRVAAVEAGEAEPLVRQVERGEDAADREVAERVGADELADLLARSGSPRSAPSRPGCRCRRSRGGRSAGR